MVAPQRSGSTGNYEVDAVIRINVDRERVLPIEQICHSFVLRWVPQNPQAESSRAGNVPSSMISP
jgi:hypothetical protein